MGFDTNKERINKSGRPKGSMNKATAEIRERYLNLIEGNFDQLETDLRTLKANERIKAIIELSKFVLPTLKATEMKLDSKENFKPIIIEWKSEQ